MPPDDTLFLAESAIRRGQDTYAAALCRHAALAGDESAATRLAYLLVPQGRVDEAIAVLRPAADAGDWAAAYQLAGLLAEQGCVDKPTRVMDPPHASRPGYSPRTRRHPVRACSDSGIVRPRTPPAW